MNISDSVLEKIRKCLALASGKGATEGEMDAALGKAKEIAMRHGIDIATVSMDAPGQKSGIDITKDDGLKIRSKFEQPYHRWLFLILDKVFQVKVVVYGHTSYNGKVISRISLIGEACDVLIAKEIFPFLEGLYPKILNRAIRERRLCECAADINGCYRGLTNGILEVNKREEEKLSTDDKSKWAMVLVKKTDLVQARFDEEFPDIKKRQQRKQKISHDAYAFGQAKGRQIHLGQMGAGARPAAAQIN